jgi:hypothetical protein
VPAAASVDVVSPSLAHDEAISIAATEAAMTVRVPNRS